MAAEAAATLGAAKAVEKINGRPLLSNNFLTVLLHATNPPCEPIALLNVPVCTSTSAATPYISAAPPPLNELEINSKSRSHYGHVCSDSGLEPVLQFRDVSFLSNLYHVMLCDTWFSKILPINALACTPSSRAHQLTGAWCAWDGSVHHNQHLK